MARYYGVPLRNGLPIGLGSAISLRKPGGAAAAVPDPYFEYTTLLLPGNGTNGAQNNTFLDSSTNNFTITRNGNTTQGTFSPFSQTGWGNYFDGTGDYLSLPSNTAFTMGTGDFTFEAWVYINAAKDYNFVFDSRASDSDAAGFGFFVDSSSRLCFYTNYNFRIQAGSVPINTWNHVALVRNGSTFTAYVNGVSVGTYTATPNLTNSTGRIGTDWASLYSMNGYISNFRLVKGTAVYTSSFTPPTAPLTAITNTSLLTCQSNRFIDNSTNNFTITRNGDVSVQAFSPFNPTAAWSAATNGGSGYFDGSGDFLNFTASSVSTSADFTVECWIYPNASIPSNHGIFALSDARFGLITVSGNLYLLTTTGDINTSTALRVYEWSHIAVTRTSNVLRVFLNGVQVGATQSNSQSLSGNWRIASNQSGEIFPACYITGARILIGTGGTSVPVPTAPPTAITNTNFLCNFTNAGIYDATSKNDLETVGNAQISTTQSKFGGSSIYLDGTGDWLSVPSGPNLTFDAGDFTVEAWVYVTSSSPSEQIIFSKRATTAAYSPILFGIVKSGGVYKSYLIGSTTGSSWNINGSFSAGSATIPLNTWTHMAVVRYGTTVTTYVNGLQDFQVTGVSGALTANSAAVAVGASAANGDVPLYGYLDDYRITKGIARYTSNFTPPTTAFPLL